MHNVLSMFRKRTANKVLLNISLLKQELMNITTQSDLVTGLLLRKTMHLVTNRKNKITISVDFNETRVVHIIKISIRKTTKIGGYMEHM